MTRILTLLFTLFVTAMATQGPTGVNQYNSAIWAAERIENIKPYEQGLGPIFTFIQGNDYFAIAALSIILAVIGAFALHFLIIGPKHFSHDGKKVFAFSLIIRIAHGLAAISWIILVPTGIIIMWGAELGGGTFVRFCRYLHDTATVIFAVSVLPMLFTWTKRMLPAIYDIRWMMIVGGYL